jgi:hypothetical protein
MALLVVLVPADRTDVSLGTSVVEALARLGVTTVSLARDEQTAAVILEGWAFDAARHDAALAALGSEVGEARTLQPVLQMAVAAAANEEGIL